LNIVRRRDGVHFDVSRVIVSFLDDSAAVRFLLVCSVARGRDGPSPEFDNE